MKEELDKLLAAERKNRRRLRELRDFKAKVLSHVNPDPKVLKMIDEEIAKLLV